MSGTIRNPIEWSWDLLRQAGRGAMALTDTFRHLEGRLNAPAPAVRRIRTSELPEVLRLGWSDFGACRTDLVFLCLIYPVAGLILARTLLDQDLLPLLFPLAAGFALLGPFAALGLYELSRQREQRRKLGLGAAFAVFRSPAIGSILVLGLLLVGIFLLWMLAAWLLYAATLGPAPPESLAAFASDLFTTTAGWVLILAGCGIGFLFALLAMSISVVAFPLLLDRDVALDTAVRTSIRAMRVNPGPMAAWGLIVAAGLVVGTLPLFVGLIVVMPILGHATWYLYRKLVLR